MMLSTERLYSITKVIGFLICNGRLYSLKKTVGKGVTDSDYAHVTLKDSNFKCSNISFNENIEMAGID